MYSWTFRVHRRQVWGPALRACRCWGAQGVGGEDLGEGVPPGVQVGLHGGSPGQVQRLLPVLGLPAVVRGQPFQDGEECGGQVDPVGEGVQQFLGGGLGHLPVLVLGDGEEEGPGQVGEPPVEELLEGCPVEVGGVVLGDGGGLAPGRVHDLSEDAAGLPVEELLPHDAGGGPSDLPGLQAPGPAGESGGGEGVLDLDVGLVQGGPVDAGGGVVSVLVQCPEQGQAVPGVPEVDLDGPLGCQVCQVFQVVGGMLLQVVGLGPVGPASA